MKIGRIGKWFKNWEINFVLKFFFYFQF
jgi:hypothetical protein